MRFEQWTYSDGGRSKYYKTKDVGDCVTRAVAIAEDRDYLEVKKDIEAHLNQWSDISGGRDTEKGISRDFVFKYLLKRGWNFVDIREKNEYPEHKTILLLGWRHIAAVKRGTLNDTYPTLFHTIVGYFEKAEKLCTK